MIVVADKWQDYQLIDAGEKEKLEVIRVAAAGSSEKNYHNIGLSIIAIWFSKYRRPILNTQAFSLNRPSIGTG